MNELISLRAHGGSSKANYSLIQCSLTAVRYGIFGILDYGERLRIMDSGGPKSVGTERSGTFLDGNTLLIVGNGHSQTLYATLAVPFPVSFFSCDTKI